MATAKHKSMTVDEFLVWNLSQDRRYELVDGLPVALRAMSGASNFHDDVVTNLIAVLAGQLRGSGCKPRTADTALRTAIRRVRRPDVTVDCAESRADTYESHKPVAVFEVLSPSTRKIDGGVKFNEYQRHPTLRTIVHIDPDRMDVAVFHKDDTGQWVAEIFSAANDIFTVAGTTAVITLAQIYDGIPVGEAEAG